MQEQAEKTLRQWAEEMLPEIHGSLEGTDYELGEELSPKETASISMRFSDQPPPLGPEHKMVITQQCLLYAPKMADVPTGGWKLIKRQS